MRPGARRVTHETSPSRLVRQPARPQSHLRRRLDLDGTGRMRSWHGRLPKRGADRDPGQCRHNSRDQHIARRKPQTTPISLGISWTTRHSSVPGYVRQLCRWEALTPGHDWPRDRTSHCVSARDVAFAPRRCKPSTNGPATGPLRANHNRRLEHVAADANLPNGS
jgi:hypothetical protein